MRINKKSNSNKLILIVIAYSIIAVIMASMYTMYSVKSNLETSSKVTLENFTEIMDDYIHSFKLFESNLKLEIDKANSNEEIANYIKSQDSYYYNIEGEDYDGVYMYYNNQYIYSWDTPYYEYEKDGYDATTRPWYIGAKEAKGEIYFSIPYRSYTNDYMLATISRMQDDGKTVIAYDIKLGAIQGFSSKLDLYNGSLTCICDKDGNIIGTTNSTYEGGNYNYSEVDFKNKINKANKEVLNASKEDKEKAKLGVSNLKELQLLVNKNNRSFNSAIKNKGSIQLELGERNISYAQSVNEYDCITIIPIFKVLPTVFITWLGIVVIFSLCLMFYENIRMRTKHSNDLEIKNLELAKAVEKADAASVAKSQFLAQMSHEIRTPMNAVIGLTSIAKTEISSPEKVADYLTKIEGSSRLLLSIINDVLDMSSIEGGKLKIDSREFNFKALITNITTVFYEQAKQKGINFEVRMNGLTEESIIGDELRVNQILMNLLSNAIKFTPSNGEIDLMILQASRSLDKVQLRFSVSDTGCGMSSEMMGRLFKPFEQESASTARKHGGSGLGLSITKKLVEMMDGSIKVNSTQGKGSVFTVDIPFKVSHSVNEQKEIKDFSQVRALVVDDDEESCKYSGVLLERLGVRYEYVISGEEALEALENAEDSEDPFTLCLIDWKMPGMDGGELTQNIRDIFGKDTIIIIVSAYDLNEVEDSNKAQGSDYFIPKPLFQSTLFNVLMKISGGDYTKIDAKSEKIEYDFTGKHVLIAEDVVLNMEVAVKLLNMVNIEVTCAEDGKQAYDMFVKSSPGTFDCILMDINMPVMDGYEATRAIRKYNREDAKSIPIYAMTANAFAQDVTAALDAGMNGHIAKPIETKVLYQTLDTAFSSNEE